MHPSGAVYSTWGSRAVAEIIDSMLFLAFFLAFAFALPRILGLALPFIYNGMLDGGSRGQTIGKRVMRIRTVSADTGELIGLERGFLRALLPLALGVAGLLGASTFSLALLVNLLDDLWPLWDPQRQSLHDKVSGSIVVRAPAIDAM